MSSPASATEPSVTYERRGAIALITLNRPHKLNAVDPPMIGALHAALDQAEADERVRVLVLRGEGRAFSAGFDLDTGTGDLDFWRTELQRDLDIVMRFWDCPKPTIAAVHGYCLGSAMEMALACDITLAARDCRFGAPEVRFGSGIVCLILPWLVSPKYAKELLLSGNDRIESGRALAMGLVNRLCDTERLLDDALALANDIAANDPCAVRFTKRAINRTLDIMGLREALAEALEADARIEASDSPEKRRFNEILEAEGMKAAVAWRRTLVEGTE